MSNAENVGSCEGRVLLTPVGRTREAPEAAIRFVGADHVIFLVSEETHDTCNELLARLQVKPTFVRVIRTPDAEHMNRTFEVLKNRLPLVLDEWRKSWSDVVVDLTGGTKAMTAALALATIHRCRQFHYVGGTVRDASGRARTGHERPVETLNPWEAMAVEEERRIAWAFNNLQFTIAAETAKRAAQRVSTDRQRVYFEELERFTRGFAAWDRFEYEEARACVERSSKVLFQNWHQRDQWHETLDVTIRCMRTLSELAGSRERRCPSMALLLDLLANARRRGEKEGRYDDAVARLYRFVEGLAQWSLSTGHGIETGDVPVERLPVGPEWELLRRDALERGLTAVKLGLRQAYLLLRDFKDPLGSKMPLLESQGEIGRLLNARNSSLLAHGIQPVGERSYRSLSDACVRLADIRREDLTQFPILPED